jgi:hypothetical protein
MCKRLRQPNSTKPSVSIESMTSLLGSYGSDSCADLSELPGYLARELHRLQPQAQSKVFEDLVGISQKHHEENVMERIAELQLAISQRSLNREAYEAAVSASPKYVSSQLLSFLRAEDFNPKAAARRVMSHFQKKLELFGLDSLVKDISLQDLDEDDTEALACGGIQFLPSKDRAGRPVFVRQYSNMKYKKRINMVSQALRKRSEYSYRTSRANLPFHFPTFSSEQSGTCFTKQCKMKRLRRMGLS